MSLLSLLEKLPGMAYRCRNDPGWTIEYANEGCRDLTGYQPQELVDQVVRYADLIEPSDRKEVQAAVARSLETQSSFELTYRIRDREGALKWVWERGSGVFDAQGECQCLEGFVTDISPLQRAEGGVRVREARLQSLIEATQDAVIFINGQAEIMRFNPAAEQIFGYQQEELLNKKVNVLMPAPYAEEHDGYIKRYEDTGDARAIGRIRSVQAKRKNGEVFPIELSVTELKVDADDVRYCAFIRDISDKVRLQALVTEKERLAAIGTTAAALAHEVGNPLNNMKLQSQLAMRQMERSELHDEGIGRSLQSISEEVERLSGLLEEFRLLSRRQTLQLAPTELHSLVGQICEEHQADFEVHRVTIERTLHPDLPTIMADVGKLRQVLLNLCKNAVEAMPEGGNLEVKVTRAQDGKHVVLEVSDSGCGIPEGVEVFEAFQTTKESGTGLGLPIAKRIVTAHGGRISCGPRYGRGTTFRVELPVDGPRPDSTPPAALG